MVFKDGIRSVVVGAAVLTLLAQGGVAYAEPDEGTSDIATLVNALAPEQGATVAGVETSDEVLMSPAGVDVSVPIDPASPIAIVSPDTETALEISLPSEVAVGQAQVADDGSVVYEDAGGGADAVVQTLEDGSVRIMTITGDDGGPREFTYAFGDSVKPVINEDGTVDLVTGSADGIVEVAGSVEAPWAVDAGGRPVPTYYEVVGDSLVQQIVTDETTTFPVVADPRVSFGVGIYLYASGAEWKAIGAFIVGTGGAVILAGCLVAKVPTGWSVPLKAFCSSIGGSNVNNYFKWIASVLNSTTLKNSTCYEFRRWTTWTGPKAVPTSNCL